MQSNINYSGKRRIQLGQSSWKVLTADTYKLWKVFTCNVLTTFRTVVSQTRRLSKPYKTWLGWTSVFTSTLTLDQMILRSFSIPLDFWYPHVVAVIFFSTTSLWLLLVLEGKMNVLRSTIFPPD